MGNRHQLFVIARVGEHYRCLAVVHHQSFYETNALSACLRLLDIFSAESNRRPLETELRLAADFYRGHPPPQQMQPDFKVHRSSPVRFPFVATCLILGSSLNFTDPLHDFPSMASFLPEDMGFDRCDNDAGIIVLDITDLDNVRYCFAAWQEIGEDPDSDETAGAGAMPQLNKPWSGSEYLRYCQISNPWSAGDVNLTRDQLVSKLSSFPLVHASALADVWPWGNWIMDQPADLRNPEGVSNRTGGASLRDQAMAKLVDNLLRAAPDELRLLDEPMRIPNFKSALRDHLIANADHLQDSPNACGLLKVAFAGETSLDWARFPRLSTETIIQAAQGPELGEARELSLCPDWSTTTAPALSKAICAFPRLHHLYIMEQPGRPNDGPLGELYAALVADASCPKGNIFLGGAASCAIKQRMWLPAAEPFCPPPSFPVQQLVVVHPSWPYRTNDFSGCGQSPVYYFPLDDAILTPSRFLDGLLRLLPRHLVYKRESDWLFSAALCFACAGPGLDSPAGFNINPLPAEIYTVAKTVYHEVIGNCFPKMRDLVPGAWTVLVKTDLIRPPPPDNQPNPRPGLPQYFFQCAFVRPKRGVIKAEPNTADFFDPEDLEVLGLDDFVRATASDVDLEHVNRRLEQLEGWGKQHHVGEDHQDRPRFSRAPMDAQEACELLKQALRRLPAVHASYQQVLSRLNIQGRVDEFWYPELQLSAAW